MRSEESSRKDSCICCRSMGVPLTDSSTHDLAALCFSSSGIRPVSLTMLSMLRCCSAMILETAAICLAVSILPSSVMIYLFLPCIVTQLE